MKGLFAGAFALALAAGVASASAQQTTIVTESPTGAAVVLEPEVRTQVREYVIKRNRESARLPGDVEIRVGATLPESVELYEIEGIPQASKYRYVVVNDRAVLVEPGSRTILQILE